MPLLITNTRYTASHPEATYSYCVYTYIFTYYNLKSQCQSQHVALPLVCVVLGCRANAQRVIANAATVQCTKSSTRPS